MKDSTLNVIAGVLCAIGLLLILGGVFLLAGVGCSARWPDDQTEYRLTGGCMVRVHGKLVPEDRVRINPEGAE